MMRLVYTLKSFLFVLLLVLLSYIGAHSATITSTASGGNWTATSTWVGGVVPATTDAVVIATSLGNSVSLNAAATCAGLSIISGATLNVGAYAITVNGSTSITGTLNLTSATGTKTFNGDITINDNGTWNESAAAVVNCSGNFTNNATSFTASTATHTFSGNNKTISGTTIINIPRITFTGTYSNSGVLTVSTLLTVTTVTLTNDGTINATTSLAGTGGLTNGSSGILNIGSAISISTLTATATGNTVIYSRAGTQTVKPTTYYNLTLSGTSTKTTTTVTVNGVLSMEGASSVAVSVAPTYGTYAGLQYNTNTARSTGAEWVTPFIAYGGITIANTGAITMAAAKVLSANVPLVINSGASFSTSTYLLTLGGDFINSGNFTSGTGGIAISGTANTQSISGFTSTGSLSMTKTAGNATISGVVSAVNLTVNGSGGTLTLAGSNAFSGTKTLTAGILALANTAALGAAGQTLALNGGELDLMTDGSVNAYNITVGGAATITSDRSTQGTGIIHTLGTLSKNASTLTIAGGSNVNGGIAGITFGAVTHSAAGAYTITDPAAGGITQLSVASVSGAYLTTFNGDGNVIQSGIWGTAAGGITTTGTGSVYLSQANTFTGAVTITSGTIIANTLANAGTASSLGTGGSTAAITIGSNGTLQYVGSGHSTSRAIILSGSGGTLDASGFGTMTLSGGVTGTGYNLVLSGNGMGIESGVIATGTGTLTKTGSGTWTLSAVNTYSGNTTITTGKLQYGIANAMSSGSVIMNGGTLSTGASTGFGDAVGTLILTDNSTIALGTGVHSLSFAASNGVSWTDGSMLTITGWSGNWNGTSGTAGKIYVGSASSGLTTTQLAQIQFFNGSSYFPATILSTGEVVPTTNSITTGTISGSPFCAGTSGISVPFVYGLASNYNSSVFTAQLSNGAGSFASPVTLQSIVSNGSGSQSISVTIPAGTATGNGYRIRVVSNSPAISGSDNGTNLTIMTIPANAGAISGSSGVTLGQTSVSYSVPVISGATSYIWSYSGTGATISGTGNTITIDFASDATSGNLTVRGSNMCGSGLVSANFSITVNAPSSCSFDDNSISGIEFSPCINFPSNAQLITSSFTTGSYFILNVVSGIEYNIYSCSNPSNSLQLSVFNDNSGEELAFATSNDGNNCNPNDVFLAFTAPFSGRVRILINQLGNCSATSTSGISIYVNPVGGSNDIDDESNAGTDSWIGHIYDGINFNNYLGYYTTTETFQEGYGTTGTWPNYGSDDVSCFDFYSNGSKLNSTKLVTFSTRYRMNSTKRGLYRVTISSDDGTSLYVDGNLIYSFWNDHSPTTYSNILLPLSGQSGVTLEFYENAGQNVVGFYNLVQIFSNTLSTNTSQSVCIGSAGSTISGDVYGSLPTGITLSGTGYQWAYSTTSASGPWTNISGATAATYTPSSGAAPFNTGGTYYIVRKAIVSSTNNVSPNPYVGTCLSNVAVFTVNPATVGGAVSGGTAICSGSTSGLLTLSGYTGSVVKWQYSISPFSSWIDIANTSATYTSGALTQTTQFRAVVQSGNCASANSTATTVTVNPNLPVSVSISASATTICAGTSVTFTATPTNGGASPIYQWKVDGSNVGTNSSTYTTSSLVNGNSVTCVMTSNATCATGNPATSNAILITVNPILTASVSIAASANPICSGSSVTFTATPTNGGTTPTYQWKLNGVNVGTNSPTYTNSSLANGNTVSCVMTSNATCVTGSPATSNTITMTVNPVLPASVSISVSANPVCSGTSVTFTATPTNGGTTPSYQWKVNGSNVGTNSATYSSNSLANGNAVTCVMTSNATCVSGSPATSNTITMTVNPNLPASVTISASATTICAGTSVTFTATPTNGGSTPTYQWKLNGSNVGTNSSTYTNATLSTGNTVSCVMTSNATCATGSPATSNTITMTVNPVLTASVSISASANPICSGSSVTFTAVPTNGGSTPTYQWKLNGVNVGTNSSTYTSGSLSNGNVISCVMTSNATCVTGSPATSNVITMTVNPVLPVSVSITATGNSICEGSEVTFTAIPVNGGVSPSYQWKLNGSNVGSNSSTYVTTTLSDNDVVRCVLTSSNTCVSGSPATSNSIIMSVDPAITNNSLDYAIGDHDVVCGTADEGYEAEMVAPDGTVFVYVNFASYGTPGGDCPDFTYSACHSLLSQSVTEEYLLGNNNVNIPADNNNYDDPCVGTYKHLYILATYTQPLCEGDDPGVISGSDPLGGTGSYSYLWESSTESASSGFSDAPGINDERDYSPGPLSTTTWYRRTVFSGECSSISGVILVKVNPVISDNTIGNPQVICTGSTPDILTGSTPSGGDGNFSYQWESSTTGSSSGFVTASGSSTNKNYSPSALSQTTWFRRTAYSGGCSDISSPVQILVTAMPSATITYVGTPFCYNSGIYSVTLTGTPGGTFSALPSGLSINSATGAINTASSTTGTYTITYSIPASGGCPGVNTTTTVTINTLPTGTISGSTTVCPNSASPLITFTGAGATAPYTFTYKINGGANLFVTTSAGNTVTVNVPTGTSGTFVYSLVSVSSANGCSQAQTGSATVVVRADLSISDDAPSQLCQYNIQLVTATVTGGSGTYSYSWQVTSPGASSLFVPGSTTNNTIWLTSYSLSPATYNYQLTVTDVNTGCQKVKNYSVAILSGLNPTWVSHPSSACVGQTGSIYAVSSLGGTTYSWSVTGGTITSGQGTNQITVNWGSVSGSGNVTVIATTGTCTQTMSQSVSLYALPTINLGTNPAVCSGSTSANLTYSGTTGSPNRYSIDFNAAANSAGFLDITDAVLSGSVIVIAVPVGAASGIYSGSLTVRSTIYGCTSDPYSVSVTINPNLPVSLTISPSANPVCSGTNVTFTAVPINGGGSPSYQWKLNGVNVGTNSSSYSNSALANNSAITCVLTSNATCATGNPAASNVVTMTVNPNLPVSLSISASSTTICPGESVSFTATPVNGGSSPAYQWKLNGTNVGTNSSSYSNSSLQNNDVVSCTLTSNETCTTSNPATSNSITITVNPNLPVSVSIAATATTICSGSSVTFTATPVNGGSSPVYQWKLNGTNVGSNISTYTTTTLVNADVISCVLTSNISCATSNPATSNLITMTVNPNLPVSVSITASSNPICSGSNVTFTASAVNGGSSPVYQWKLNGSIVGSNSATYSSSTLANNDIVTCIVTSNATCATGSPATSNSITMIVNPMLTASVTIAASANPVCAGTSVTFTATPVNGGTTPSYQWKLNGSNVGTNSTTYSNAALANNDLITCIMTSNAGCVVSNPVTSNAITMTVNPNMPVSVTIASGVGNTICSGTSVTFTATPVNGGSSPSYQWKKNGTNVGSNSNVYTDAGLANSDLVLCILTSNLTCTAGNPATSNQISMTVNLTPSDLTSISASPSQVYSDNTAPVILTAAGGGGTGAVLKWYAGGCGSGTAIGTGSPLTISAPLQTTTYYARWENGTCYSNCLSTTVTVYSIYRSKVTGDWSQASTWEIYSNGSWINASVPPTSSDGTITIRSPHVVTVSSAGGYINVDEVTINAGGKLVVNISPANWWFNVVDGPGTDLTINGTLEYQDDILSIVPTATVVVGNGGKFQHNLNIAGNYPITVPTASWDINSTYEVLSSNQLAPAAGLNQNFGNFTWNYSGQTSDINLSGGLSNVLGNMSILSTGTKQLLLTNTTDLTLTIGKDLIIQNGTLDFSSGNASTKVINLNGNYTQTGGIFKNSNSGLLTFNFLGFNKIFTLSGGTLTSTYINWNVKTVASLLLDNSLPVSTGRTLTLDGTLDCGISSSVYGAGTFAMSNGATLIMGSPAGITSTSGTGNIQTSTCNFSTGGDFIYNGTGAQVTGNRLPALVRNLTISNVNGATLSSSVTINGTMTLNSGIFSIGNNTLGFQNADIPLVQGAGTITTSENTNLLFGTAGNTGGAAFTLPSSLFTVAPTINNLTINRLNGITLNNQKMSIRGFVLCNGPLTTNGNLVLLSTADQTALIDGSGSSQVIGNVSMQRYISTGFGYKYFSSPFQSSTVADFASYIDLEASFPTFYSYDENKISSGWVNYVGITGPLTPMLGYAGNMGTSMNEKTLELTGIVNNNLNTHLALYNHNRAYSKGFNLVGNAYPSPVDWDATSGWTKNNIDNAVYYFNTGYTNQYTGTYSTYINGVSSDGIANNIIPAMQGFFIHVSDGSYPVSASFGMDNRVRINNLTPSFHKSLQETVWPFVRLAASFSDRDEDKDYMVVYFDEQSSTEFENDKDALKLMNTDAEVPNLYCFTPASQRLAIMARPGITDSAEVVPLGISLEKEGWIDLAATDIHWLPAGLKVYLADSSSGVVQDLQKHNQYRVYLNQGEETNRFALIFSLKDIENTPPLTDRFQVSYSAQVLHVNFELSMGTRADLELTNMLGQQILGKTLKGNGIHDIDTHLATGIYVVTLRTPSGVHSQKIYISNP